ncbi:MAG TPA: MFS transporter [Gemmatimonadaceae bacterium]|nr:MFS transporter [Gemmatimonadaceae bacterium]
MGLITEPNSRETRRPLYRWPFSFADSRLNPWRGLGGLPRDVWLLFATNLINRAGMMVLPFLVLYLTRERHFTPGQAGFALAVYGAAAIFAGPISGWLSDRIGAPPIMRASLLLSGSVLLLFPLAHSRAAVYGTTILWAGCAELFRPASLAAITHVVSPEQRRPAYALNRLAINLGMSIGPALGGFLAAVSFRAMFLVDALTTILAGVVLSVSTWSAATGGSSDDNNAAEDQSHARSLLLDWRLLVFLSASFLVGIVFYQHESALPLYLVQYLSQSPAFYGTLFTINTLLIVALEVPLNQATSHWPNMWALFAGCLLFAIGFGALAIVKSASGVLITVVVWTFGEMMLFPAMAAHLGEIAPENRRGAYMGAYSMSLALALTFGPWLGTQLLASTGPVGVWSAMFGLGALAAVLMVYGAPHVRLVRVVVAAES